MKKIGRLAIGVFCLLAGQAAFAQTAAVPPASPALMVDLRTLSSPEFAGRLTGTPGSQLAQAYITRRFKEIGLQPFGQSYAMPFTFTDTRRNVTTTYASALNLVGQIRGSAHPERVMVVSAHYDHLGVQKGQAYLGADDNASGVAAMLAVAAHFKQHPPRNTIVFAAFDSEELGLRGANAFVNAPPVPLKNVTLNLNFDMVSRNDKNEIYVAGTRYTPSLKALVAKAATGSTLKVIMGHDSRPQGEPADYDWTGSSDHGAFHKAGIPFLYFGVEDHADYHKPGDTFEKVDPKFYAEVVRMLVDTAAILDQNLDKLK
jgi:Zn-dependent M28 family amino/carboxypeptidase